MKIRTGSLEVRRRRINRWSIFYLMLILRETSVQRSFMNWQSQDSGK